MSATSAPNPRLARRIGLGIVSLCMLVAVLLVVAVVNRAQTPAAPDRVVEATTAPPADVATTPRRLGDNRFQVKVSDAPDARPRVWAAGAGFAVLVDDQLSAYGADGAQRWHYRRSGDGDISEVHVYDGGATLILAIAEPGAADDDTDSSGAAPVNLVALDAVTGTQLWTSQEPDLLRAFGGYRDKEGPDDGRPPSRFLASRTPDYTREWVGYDPRTGRELWATDEMGCESTDVVDTATHIVCLHLRDGSVDVALFDAATGKLAARHRVPAPAQHPEFYDFLGDAIEAGAQGLVLQFWYSAPAGRSVPMKRIYVNTGTWAVAELGERTAEPSNDPHGGFLVADGPEGDRQVSLYGPPGTPRCTFDHDAAPGGGINEGIVWLDDQIITVVYSGHGPLPTQTLTVFNRADCQPITTLPQPAHTDIAGLLAARGVTVVIRTDDTGAYVDGYTPRPT